MDAQLLVALFTESFGECSKLRYGMVMSVLPTEEEMTWQVLTL